MGRNDKKSKEPKMKGKYLEHGTVILNTITRRVNVHNTLYCWRVFDYSNLKPQVIYYKTFDSEKVKCAIKMFKTKNALYLCLRSRQLVNKVAQFYVISEKKPTINLCVTAVEIYDGLYVGEFKCEMFEDPELPYLLNGMLTICFRYISDQITDNQETTFDGLDVLSDLDELCCDLKNMYLESVCPDFEIKVKDYEFKTHKFILSARCGFFEKFFDKNPEARQFSVDTSPGILHEVLLYVYCGELKNMNLDCMMKVLDLADDLKISSLIDRCYEYFNKHVDKSNFDEFHAMVKEKKCPELDAVLEKIRTGIHAS